MFFDNQVLAAAFDGNADYLVTGDKAHLLPLKVVKGIPIVSVAELLEIIK